MTMYGRNKFVSTLPESTGRVIEEALEDFLKMEYPEHSKADRLILVKTNHEFTAVVDDDIDEILKEFGY